MDRKHTPTADPERAEEARHVAEDAIEAAQDGNPEEARFLAGEARSLDANAANAALAGTELAKRGTKR